jgi:hypothetical protein
MVTIMQLEAVTLDAVGTFSWIALAAVGAVPGGWSLGAHVAWRPVSVLTPARSAPPDCALCGALPLAGIQQPTQNWCGPRSMTK